MVQAVNASFSNDDIDAEMRRMAIENLHNREAEKERKRQANARAQAEGNPDTIAFVKKRGEVCPDGYEELPFVGASYPPTFFARRIGASSEQKAPSTRGKNVPTPSKRKWKPVYDGKNLVLSEEVVN